MARPESNTVSYFPHKIGDGKKIFSIEAKYGNDGYASWFKILEKLATTENHFLDLNDEVEVMYLSAKCRVSEETLFAIINDLTRLGCFDKLLWSKRYLWSQVFIESIQDAYSRRINNCITYEGLCKHLSIKCTTVTQQSATISDSNTQSKVKDSKEELLPELPLATSGELNTNSVSYRATKFVDKFNSIKEKSTNSKGKFRRTDKVLKAFTLRIKNYKAEDIMLAIKNAFSDTMHKEQNYQYLTPEYILREDILERYINFSAAVPMKPNQAVYTTNKPALDHANRS